MYKRKIIVAVSILLVCVILLISASYAWLSLSVSPEISGIDTHVGANGSLEIALLSNSTYYDPSLIRATVGSSSSILDAIQSNQYWGSLIDLTNERYGLKQISLLPSRLNASIDESGNTVVGSNLLAIPEYDVDGRFNYIVPNTVSAIYENNGFIYSTQEQNYGVRGIGPVSKLSTQQSALTNARSAVKTYTKASISATSTVLKSNGDDILRIYFDHYINGVNVFSKSDVTVLKNTARQMQNAINYVDLALRQGIVAYAASIVKNEDDFKTIRDTVENSSIPLSLILTAVSIDLPDSYSQWIQTIENDKKTMLNVSSACSLLNGETFTWDQISPIINNIINENGAYLEQYKLSSLNSSNKLTEDNILTLSPSAGIMATIADFSGNYSTFVTYSDSINIEIGTTSSISPSRLVTLSSALDKLETSDKEDGLFSAPLSQVYGYALDLAFRCNQESNLLLQTLPAQRLDDDLNDALAQGAGSYMEFTSDQLNTDKMIAMMDAIRIGFMDNQNHLLALAKLNTSNHTKTDDRVTAPLYLYDYQVAIDGGITMGERRDTDSTITNLPQNTPVVITVIVWLDGDAMDNTLSAILPQSMTGILNLQFSSSAELHPADIPLVENK